MKRTILSILVIAAAGFTASAQSVGFINVTSDAEGLALAGATVARDANAFVADNNVAAAALSDKTFSIAASYGMWAPNTTNTGNIGLGGFFHKDKIAVTLIGKYNLSQPYQTFNQVARQLEDFTPVEFEVGAGFAYSVIDHLSAGINLKYISSSIAEKVAGSAFAADLGVMYNTESIKAGLSVNNIGTKLKYDSSEYDLPMSIKAGAAYSVKGFTVSAEGDMMINAGFMASLGAEYWIKDIVAVRAGYHYGNAEKTMPSFVSTGLGLKFKGLNLNAAYLLACEPLANTLMVTLGYAF